MCTRSAMTHDGRALRVLVVIDEYTRECLALRVARRLGSLQVIETLADVMLVRGVPEHIRSDNCRVAADPAASLAGQRRGLRATPQPACAERQRKSRTQTADFRPPSSGDW